MRLTYRVFCLSFALSGCGLMLDDPAMDAGADASISMDASTSLDAGAGIPCGPVTCSVGLECCNASCGTCVGPGGSCSGEECVDDGGPGDDGGMSDAGTRDGGAPDGGNTACDMVVCPADTHCCPGCDGATFCSDDPTCPTPVCPSCDDTTPCPETDYCARRAGTCGGPGTCMPRPDTCTADCPGVCGCDGVTYCNACGANGAGTTVTTNEPCLPRGCGPMDAHSIGDCLVVLGYAWNGFACTNVDCICEGADCGRMFDSLEACQLTYEPCVCGGFLGLTCPLGSYCEFPPDATCGFSDGTGACRPLPMGTCPDRDEPVCGCNGDSFRNSCSANLAGVSVAHPGECTRPGPDPGTP